VQQVVLSSETYVCAVSCSKRNVRGLVSAAHPEGKRNGPALVSPGEYIARKVA
jgi:hypothetical protein